MNPVEALQAARDFGVCLEVEGNDLVLAASARPPTTILEALKRHKSEIIAILISSETGPTAAEWLALFDERAAINEFDGGHPRELAELQAIGSCVLDLGIANTSQAELESFIRSLPDHIGRTADALRPK